MKRKWMLLMMCLVFGLAGCQSKPKVKSEGQNTQREGTIHAVTSFYPIYILSLNVVDGVEGLNLTNMMQPQKGFLHDYQPTTDDMKKLEDADMFLINGAGMEGFLDKVLEKHPKLDIVDTSQGVNLVKMEEGLDYEDDNHDDLDGHKDEDYNGYIWLSIPNAVRQTENIRDAFCRTDPAHEEEYRKNTEAFVKSMKALTEKMRKFDLAERKDAAVFHEGFDYFREDFGFNSKVGIFVDDKQEPSAKELEKAIREAKDKHIGLFFAAEDGGKKVAETIAKEVNGKVFILDPVTKGEMKKDAYEKAMTKNIEVLREALGK